MSRQPPLPPGPPPRSQSQYMDSRDRDRYNGSDSYRPNHPSPNRGYYPSDRRDMYEFSGSSRNQSSNGYRSGSYNRVPPPGQNNYAPGTDTYRPQDSGFNFRFDAPPSINPRQYDDRRDRDYRPRSPPRHRNHAQDNQSSYRHNGAQNRGSRGGYRGRAGPRLASDRAFLKTNRDPTPDLMPGMDEDSTHTKFKALEGLSDSDEAEMDISEDDDNASGSEQPKKKMARTGQKAADGDSVPKWSNPDPYTALPPPDESLRKKKDVVKLIRKARVEGGSAAKTEEAAEDFISFDFGGDEDEDKDDESDAGNLGVPGAPTGPRYSHRDNIHKVDSRPPPHPEPELTLPVVPGKRAASPIDLTSDPALGNRKRTFNDEIKAPPLIHKANKGKKNPPASGKILPEWRSRSDASATPWIKLDHSNTANMGVWLHKEIMDFYHHVKPREFEQAIRTKVVDDLRAKVREEFYGAEIQCFGSFMAGLYLPTADMDLVCLSRSFLQGRHGQLADRSALYKFKAFLDRSNLVMPGSVELIPKAKVPLVKYVDRVTGLKIDISFENDTGVIANKTFQDWKTEFPSMPILVTVIKHFLAMRGLNEPVNGGIGGFSVTCLVVSLLQHMPQVQSRNMIPEHHLGEVLMEFFDLYGNLFNYQTTAIQMNPPALIRRESNTGAIYRNTNQVKFSIIDPNRSSNDIAGGSSNAAVIIKEFSKAFQLLQARMGHLQNAKDRKHESILGCLLAGDYTTFDLQREHLAHIHEHLIGPIDDRTII